MVHDYWRLDLLSCVNGDAPACGMASALDGRRAGDENLKKLLIEHPNARFAATVTEAP